ncbi:hypothetical protein K525DRAFT_274700 [Schizophyllum commune Loenen D]|nr:hypothetical protein K525DRAFT_274700 [Schizophyllum commune Loenen D]
MLFKAPPTLDAPLTRATRLPRDAQSSRERDAVEEDVQSDSDYQSMRRYVRQSGLAHGTTRFEVSKVVLGAFHVSRLTVVALNERQHAHDGRHHGRIEHPLPLKNYRLALHGRRLALDDQLDGLSPLISGRMRGHLVLRSYAPSRTLFSLDHCRRLVPRTPPSTPAFILHRRSCPFRLFLVSPPLSGSPSRGGSMLSFPRRVHALLPAAGPCSPSRGGSMLSFPRRVQARMTPARTNNVDNRRMSAPNARASAPFNFKVLSNSIKVESSFNKDLSNFNKDLSSFNKDLSSFNNNLSSF